MPSKNDLINQSKDLKFYPKGSDKIYYLRNQQEALRRTLLNKPVSESRKQKISRVKNKQLLIKDYHKFYHNEKKKFEEGLAKATKFI